MDKTCAIIAVKNGESFHWKWRATRDGENRQSSESYALFYDCLAAARALGYQPAFQSDSGPIVVK